MAIDTLIDPRQIWQVPQEVGACNPVMLNEGTFVAGYNDVRPVTEPVYLISACDGGQPFIYDNMPRLVSLPHLLVVSTSGWQDWHRSSGKYSQSVPVLVSTFTSALAMSLAVSGFVTGDSTRRYPLLIRVACYYNLVLLSVSFGLLLHIVEEQYHIGESSSYLIAKELITERLLIASYVSAILLLGAQVRVAVELFDRRMERRIATALGLGFIITALALWGVAEFGVKTDIVPAVIEYLFELAVYILFAGSVLLKVVETRRAALSAEMATLTVLAMVVSMLPAAFFVADLAGWWVGRMVDHIFQISNATSVVMIWYWTQALADSRQSQEVHYPLGRRVYEGDDGKEDLYFTVAKEDEENSSTADTDPRDPGNDLPLSRAVTAQETFDPESGLPPGSESRPASVPMGWRQKLSPLSWLHKRPTSV